MGKGLTYLPRFKPYDPGNLNYVHLLDEAIDVASKHPMAWAGAIELRPVLPDDED